MDPYKVLGVSPDASDDEIRSAYRALAKKYHPDNYVNSPIADVAAEKMKEVNAAYEQIQQLRKGGASSSYSGSSSHSSPGGVYAVIRTLISQGNIGRAEAMLNEIPIQQRGGEWYFCMGSVCYRRGWMDRAAEYFRTAAENDPTNREYAAAAERMNGTRQVYRQRGASGSSGGISGCDICSTLLCADCLCECMGGDLIPCC